MKRPENSFWKLFIAIFIPSRTAKVDKKKIAVGFCKKLANFNSDLETNVEAFCPIAT